MSSTGIAAGPRRVRVVVTAAAALLCFGLAGTLMFVPGLRARWVCHASQCVVCRRNQRALRAAVVLAAVVLLAAVGVRVAAWVDPPVRCHSRIEVDGRTVPEPLLPLASAGTPLWRGVRAVLAAPASGIALTVSDVTGLRECAGPPLLVTFRWPAEARGGSMVGDVFITWAQRLDGPGGVLQERLVTTGDAATTRFGPNISSDRADEERVGEHEVRHLDQWAVASAIGGPAAFPLAYAADYLLFPYDRSHFERAAGLADGGYDSTGSTGPAPLRGPLLGVLAAIAILLRHRLRMLWRLPAGRTGRFAAEPGRCLRHTRTGRSTRSTVSPSAE